MPDYIKEVPISELKRDYSSHHGFVFLSSNKSSNEAIRNLAETLRNQGITRDLPILVTRLEQGIAFVYENMDGPRFWQMEEGIEQMTGIKTVPLCFFLREVKGE